MCPIINPTGLACRKATRYNSAMNDINTLHRAGDIARNKFLSAVYGWMVLALGISAAAAFAVASSFQLQRLIFGSGIGVFALIIAEIALVWILAARLRTMQKSTAQILFIVYSILNGLTLSSVLLVYTGASVAKTFVIAAAMFAGMSIYAMKTRSDILSWGRYLYMALIGLIIASLVNIFLRSSGLEWLISIVGVVLFTGLTAYDTQRIMQMSRSADSSDAYAKIAIFGALQLYLDFINLFLYLLRLFGRRE